LNTNPTTRSLVSPFATLRLRSTLEFRLSVESTVSSVSTLFLLALLIIKELFEVVRDDDMKGEFCLRLRYKPVLKKL